MVAVPKEVVVVHDGVEHVCTEGPVCALEHVGSSVKFIEMTVGVPSALNFTPVKRCEFPTMLATGIEYVPTSSPPGTICKSPVNGRLIKVA